MVKIGSRLDNRYEVLDSIGQGSFSSVYQAFDHKHNKRVAVKLLNRNLQKSSLENIVRFRREAQTLARLHHKNSPPIHLECRSR